MKKVYFIHLVYICNVSYFNIPDGSRHGRDCMVVCLTTTMHSVPITITVASSNPADGEVYSIHYYEIKFVSDLRQIGGFSRYSGFLQQEF